MAKLIMESGRFQLVSLLVLAISVCSENVFDADFSLISRLGNSVRTTMSTAYKGFNSSLAIDGKAGNPDNCPCCSIANGQTPHAWLEIDLGQQYYVTGIKIYGRNDAKHVDQSTDIDVFIGNRSLSHQALPGPLISIQHGTSMYPYTKESTTRWRFKVFLIRKRSADYLTICEVQFREDANIINQARQTLKILMSTTNTAPGKSFIANLAVDGDDRTNAGTCNCCSAMDGKSVPWWQLDLGRKYLVSRMVLIGTSDVGIQSKNVDVYISNDTLLQASSPMTSNESLFSAVDDFSGSLYSTNKTTIFQFLMIRRWYPSDLTICELKLYTQECDFGRYGVRCLHSCHCSNNAQCDAATGHCPSGCAPGYTGAACETDTNLVLGIKGMIKTNMSTTYIAAGHLFAAELAVDGNANTNAGTCSCCSATDGSSSPWWQLDLGRKYLISRMELIGTTEIASQSQNVNVYISNHTLLQGASPIPNNESFFSAVDNFSGSLYSKNETTIFQFLMIRRLFKSVLTICELKLYAQECNLGWYGKDCLYSCYCSNNTQCDAATGHCSNVCASGYTGAACDTACSDGLFGPNCTNQCGKCSQNSSCDKDDGHCSSGCAPGYLGSLCKTVCSVGSYGQNCTNSCGNCIQKSHCDHVDGHCTGGCEAGFQGAQCNIACSDGVYGRNCTNQCGYCSQNSPCDKVDGHCLNGCAPGYVGPGCKTVCTHGSYGQDCGHQCHCANGTACDTRNGSCPAGCDIGWSGPSCQKDISLLSKLTNASTEASNIWAGFNASLALDGLDDNLYTSFSACKCCSVVDGNNPWWQIDLGAKYLIGSVYVVGRHTNPDSQSKDINVIGSNGTATVNDATNTLFNVTTSALGTRFLQNFTVHPRMLRYLRIQKWTNTVLTICEVRLIEGKCQRGWFGDECKHRCHCADQKACNPIDGTCQSALCSPGWRGSACETACEDGTFGQNCSGVAHCINSTANNYVNGSCQAGVCGPGWRGDACDKACTNGAYGPNCGLHCHCANGIACDTRNGSCPADCDVGWSGPSCQKDESLLSKLTNLATTASNIWGCFNASLALDGLDDNLYTSFNACKCCSVVDGTNPWWQVDLGAKNLVGAVYIVGRHTNPDSQSKDINIIGSNDTETVNVTTNTLFNVTTSALGTRFLHNFTVHPRMLRYLRIQKRTSTVLTICEVRLIEGKCGPGWFGDKCRNVCHCADQKVCNPVYGTCQSALCSPGWLGNACETACMTDRFGQNCSGVAHCINGTANDNVNGSCQAGLCAPGWRGQACDTACENGTFGQNCSGVANCFNGTVNNVNGSCIEGLCYPGWKGEACDTVCHPGTFGLKCLQRCNCYNDRDCTPGEGICPDVEPRCSPGWKGRSCDQECNHGTFGQGCSQLCHCHGDRNCSPAEGICPDLYHRCARGWQGRSCDQACKAHFFGLNCSEDCGGCKHDAPCDPESGICPTGCAEGYTGDTCAKITVQDQTDSASSHSKLVGPIAGGSCAIVACLVVVSILLIMNFRRKQRRDTNDASNTDHVYTQPNLRLTRTESSVYDTLDTVKDESIERVQSSHDYVNAQMETIVS